MPVDTTTATNKKPPDLNQLKDAVNAHLMRAQTNIRKKSRLSETMTAVSHNTTPDSLGSISSLSSNNSTSYPFPYTATPTQQPKSETPTPRGAPKGFPGPTNQYGNPLFPVPNIYDLTLRLNSAIGIELFWKSVVDILAENYCAERVTLAIPNDLTDVENVPWGLKATYDGATDFAGPTSAGGGATSTSPPQGVPPGANIMDPSVPFENEPDDDTTPTTGMPDQSRPRLPERSREPSVNLPTGMRGKVHRALLPLEDGDEPLIDNIGVARVIERGRPVVLSREYRDINTFLERGQSQTTSPAHIELKQDQLRQRQERIASKAAEKKGANKGTPQKPLRNPMEEYFSEKPTSARKNVMASLSSHLHQPFPPKRSASYEEYEQAMLSPWSSSPAPSPAVHTDSNRNPFFESPMVEEEAFSPSESSPVYTPYEQVYTIGMESAHSVIHVPLIHPTSAKPVSGASGTVPIGILSFLSKVIPYPQNLVDSLDSFAPLIATSLSQALSHSNILHQLAYAPRRPSQSTSGSSPAASRARSYSRTDSLDSSPALASSPSFSSSSSVGDRASWEGMGGIAAGMLSPNVAMLGTPLSAGEVSGDSYFSRVRRPVAVRAPASSSSVVSSAASNAGDLNVPMASGSSRGSASSDDLPTPKLSDRKMEDGNGQEEHATSPGRRVPSATSRRRKARRPASLLHSHGASTSATLSGGFGSGSVPAERPVHNGGRRSMSTSSSSSGRGEMPVPSARLLKVIVDSIPVHVFTASPQTGKITWINARSLAYRGQTAGEVMKDFWGALHPDDRDSYVRGWKEAIAKGVGHAKQVRMRRFDGVYRWFMTRAVPLRDSRGAVVHWFGTSMDIHEQKLAEQDAARQAETAASEGKYRSLAEASPQIVFAATPSQGITYANTQWFRYTGGSFEATVRLGFMSFVHPDDRIKCALPAGVCPTKDAPFSSELRLRKHDGEYRWHLIKCVCVEGSLGNGEDDLWFGTCTDINDHKLLEQKLKETNEAAQRAMESKTRFLSNMSHEIRTPLIGITGMVGFLMDSQLTLEQLDYAHTIQQSADALLSVINDILDLSKVEAGMMKLTSESFNVRSMVEDANELLSTMATAKGLELNYVVEENVPAIVSGDRIRLRQVVLNVIGNAIKFTSSGEVFSRVSVAKDADVGADEILLNFEVHDTGPGFDKKDEQYMFKPFSQIDTSSTRKHGGTGLGLVISRQLIELHGGKMTCSSVKGVGSTFYFSAKFKLAETVATAAKNSAEPDAWELCNTDPPATRPMASPGKGNTSDNTVPSLSQGSSASSGWSSVSSNPVSAAMKDQNSVLADAFAVTPPAKIHQPIRDIGATQRALQIAMPPKSDSASLKLALPTPVKEKVAQYVAETTGLNKAARNLRPPNVPSTPSSSGESTATVTDKPSGPPKSSPPTPPMYNILVVAEQPYGRMAIQHHIRMTLPKTIPAAIATSNSFRSAYDIVTKKSPTIFSHIVISLPEQSEVNKLLQALSETSAYANTMCIVLTTPIQRSSILDGCGDAAKILGDRLQFIFKPVKPSKFSVIFDPQSERNESTDMKRQSAQQVVAHQKEVFKSMEDEVGGKGHKVLLVEDNPVNQKVMQRFLLKVGLEVEIASDGVECVQTYLNKPHGYYSLILCDLHMPRKDGFEATREIRDWEQTNLPPGVAQVPIVALSANVMSDVAERCTASGFTSYVSKPVDFSTLKDTIVQLLNIKSPGKV
ncbi:hypothetical protein YB2330_003536 [Saitoella coloradoensis]